MDRRRSSKHRRQVETSESAGDLQIASLWSDMPLDVGNLILDKLPEVVEHIRFGAVCKGWYIILKQFDKPSRNVLPMLLVTSRDTRQTPLLFSLSCLAKHYSKFQLRLPSRHRRYIGTSHGWVATQNLDFTFTLVNPFGRDIQTINLPSVGDQSWNSTLDDDILKLVISSDSTPSDYTIVAIYCKLDEFATIKAGEKSWVYINTHSTALSDALFKDIIFHQGAVYLVDHLCNIIKVDVHSRPPVIKAVHHLLRETELHTPFVPYLVESTFSDLYLLQRFYESGICWHDRPATIIFNIFKLKVHGEKGEQFITTKKSKGLKGDTFFIGDDTTSLAIKSTGCIPNSIYFTYYECCGLYFKRASILANYSIEDGDVGSVYYKTMRPKGVSRPIWMWIVPQQHFAPSIVNAEESSDMDQEHSAATPTIRKSSRVRKAPNKFKDFIV